METPRKNLEIDQADREILNILQRDASLSHAAIGGEVGLSASSVNERIRKLRSHHVIKKIVAIVDAERVGTEIFAYIMASVTNANELQFEKEMMTLKEVLECHHVTGEYSYLLKVRTKSTKALELLIMKKIKSFPGVTRTFTQVVLSSSKEETAVVC